MSFVCLVLRRFVLESPYFVFVCTDAGLITDRAAKPYEATSVPVIANAREHEAHVRLRRTSNCNDQASISASP